MNTKTFVTLICCFPLFSFATNCARTGFWDLPEDYDLTELPSTGSIPTNLYLGLNVRDITKIDEMSQIVQISMYFEVGWKENRLNLSNLSKWKMGEDGYKVIDIAPECIRERFWNPRLEIYGLDRYQTHTIFKEMSSAQLNENKMVYLIKTSWLPVVNTTKNYF